MHILILVHFLVLSVKAYNIFVISNRSFVRPPVSGQRIAVKFDTGTLWNL